MSKQTIDPARKAAVTALIQLHRGGWSNLSLKNALAPLSLSLRQRAFASALFYGTAERLVTLDYMLAPHLRRKIDKLDVEVRAALETGLYQIHFMDVPARAAVNEAVKLTRHFRKASAAGFVNAVLRKAAKKPLPQGPFENEAERLSVLYSVSPVVAAALMQALPDDCEAFLGAAFEAPPLTIHTNLYKTTAKALEEKLLASGATTEETPLDGGFNVTLATGVAGDALYQEGYYYVQGLASRYATACLNAKSSDAVLDLCAAPGGKTAALAMAMFDPAAAHKAGQGITACDMDTHRVNLLQASLDRLGLDGVTACINDAAVYNDTLGHFDKILCDVPCSGLGTIAKKPDLRYGTGENWAELEALQTEILQTAGRYLAKGGRLVYSTCTVRRQENQDIVNNFLKKNDDFRVIEPPAKPENAILEDNMMLLLPHKTGLDGFFVATLERV